MDNGLQTIKISELPEAITLNESDYSLIVQNGTSKKIKGLLLKGNAGDNGKSIEIQKTDTHIQWRQEGGQWINLVALADLKGDKGEQGEGANVDLTDYTTKVWVTQQLASYYTKAEIDLALSNKADISHAHTEYASIDHIHNYNDLTNKPTIPSLEGYATENFVTNNYASKNHNHSEYASSSHRHDASEIDNLPSGAGGSTPVALTEPYDDDIPRIFLSEGILPTTKTSTTMKFEYISKNKRYSGYIDIKCQGTSSMAYSKKNFTIKTYNDKALENKMKINFKNWGNQNKFCLKANFIDISHARNIVSARLWSDVVKTRENYLELPELLRTSPNSGAIDGFFVKIYANGVYQGRYTMNIPKDGWMSNMDKSLDEHCILCGENYQSGLFRATAQIDGTDWSDELHDTVPTSIVNRWNQVINFVMNSSDSEFKANIGQYFDLTSLIDYYIFAYVSCGLDSMGKNQIYMTYDGQKWFASMYDMDSTWGLYWNGQNFVSASYRMQDDYESGTNGRAKNLLYLKLEKTFINEIKERYAVLRNGALSETNIINRFEEFMICNSDLIKEDYEIFNDIPSQNTNNIKQIRQYVVDRCKYVDGQIDNLIIPVPCTGITLDKTSLTFTDNTPQTLQVTVEPTNTTDKISYSINPTSIAKIANGVVTPLKNGTATITVTCGTISKTCSVDITGIEEGSVTDDYTALDISTIQKGQPFTLYDGDLDLNDQTVFADITLDDSLADQNILSIGKEINSWSGNSVRLHCYYPKSSTDSRQLEININFNFNAYIKTSITITNNEFKIALNTNGIYVNGTKVVDLSESANFTSLVAQKTAQIGSLEGSKRSKATYNKVSIYNRLLSSEELITLTSIGPGLDGGDITLPDNYTELKSNFDPNGNSFVESMEFNPLTQTFYADIIIDNSTLKQNILSIGENISIWGTNVVNLHTYNKTATGLEISIVPGEDIKYNGAISSDGRIKIAWCADKIYVNGSSVGDTAYKLTSDTLAKFSNSPCQYGSAEGTVRSVSHYNTIGIINSTKTAEELAQLTTI